MICISNNPGLKVKIVMFLPAAVHVFPSLDTNHRILRSEKHPNLDLGRLCPLPLDQPFYEVLIIIAHSPQSLWPFLQTQQCLPICSNCALAEYPPRQLGVKFSLKIP